LTYGIGVTSPEENAKLDERTDRLEPKLERGDDAEVAAAAADRPEEGGVLIRRRPLDASVGGDDLGRDEIVRAEAGGRR
jgi:hypothetical protein